MWHLNKITSAANKVLLHASQQQRVLRKYRRWLTSLPLDSRTVLLDQQNGRSLDGNVYAIMRELLTNERWSHLQVRFATTKDTDAPFSAELERRGLHVQTVRRGTYMYYYALATSAYLITNNDLPAAFVKRPGQVLLNTWHGIPLKTLGRAQVSDAPYIGNTQRGLAFADYLLIPNPAMEKRFVRDYMLEGISTATILPLAYPRNEAFLKEPEIDLVHSIRNGLGHVYAWLPTFRGSGNERGVLPARMHSLLGEIDELLTDDEILYIKLHLVERQPLELDKYAHIRQLPATDELYSILATCDALVTDYSSVMFDYPLCKGKVVLFPYDEDAYSQQRGLYQPISSLPFPKVYSAKELIDELRSPKGYNDTELLQECWPTQTPGVSKVLCERLFIGSSHITGEHEISHTQKPMALVYSELECDLCELEEKLVDLSRSYSVRLAFPWKLGIDKTGFLQQLPSTIAYTPLRGQMLLSPTEHLGLRVGKVRESTLELDRQRTFGTADFKCVIIHDGCDQRWLALFKHLMD